MILYLCGIVEIIIDWCLCLSQKKGDLHALHVEIIFLNLQIVPVLLVEDRELHWKLSVFVTYCNRTGCCRPTTCTQDFLRREFAPEAKELK